jgi:hypothetical protein
LSTINDKQQAEITAAAAMPLFCNKTSPIISTLESFFETLFCCGIVVALGMAQRDERE